MKFIKKKSLYKLILKGNFILILSILLYFLDCKKIIINDKAEYDLIIPSNLKDVKLILKHKKFYEKFLAYKNIILIIPTNNIPNKFNGTSIYFVNENILVPKTRINEFLWKMRGIRINRVNWYEQQFLKMAYSRICKKEYYLVWDEDTIPLRPIKMFQCNHPIFDMALEHNTPYFNTIERLIPGLKIFKQSYISEHMMVKTELMRNLLDIIEMNNNIPGKEFWEKILMCIDIKDIDKSGFSEFETYGSFVDTKFPSVYKHRKWFSRRDAFSFFNNSENLNEKDIKWLSKDYDALSFEKWKMFNFSNKKLGIIKNNNIQRLYRPKNFFNNFENIMKKFK